MRIVVFPSTTPVLVTGAGTGAYVGSHRPAAVLTHRGSGPMWQV